MLATIWIVNSLIAFIIYKFFASAQTVTTSSPEDRKSEASTSTENNQTTEFATATEIEEKLQAL